MPPLTKELRFTRSAQAFPALILGIALLAAATTITLTTYTICQSRGCHELPYPLTLPFWLCIPLAGCFAFAYYCTKHAYLTLNQIGLEVYPLWKPKENFRLIPWCQIAAIDFNPRQITLHTNEEKTSGVILSLSPLSKSSRNLLKEALEGVALKTKKT